MAIHSPANEYANLGPNDRLGPNSVESAGQTGDGVFDTLEGADRDQFADLVENSPQTSIFQNEIWIDSIGKRKNHRYKFLLFKDNGVAELAGVVRLTYVMPFRCLATIQRGPVFRDPKILDRCLPGMVAALKRLGACTLLVNPRWEDADAKSVETILGQHGFATLPRHEQPMHTVTAVVDLTRSEDEIFAALKGSCRRQIRTGDRKGLKIRHAKSTDDITRFDALYRKFAAAKNLGISGRPSVSAQAELVKRLGGVFLLAELGERLVGGHIVLRENKRAIWSVLASDPDVNIPRGYNLLWEAMREMKKAGCETFDLAGLPDEDDDQESDESAQNRERFKMSFVPRRVRLVRTHVLPIRLISHAAAFPARQMFRRLRP